MDKKSFIVYTVMAIAIIAVYVYVSYISEKRAQEMHDLEMSIAKADAARIAKLQNESAQAAIDTIKELPAAISKIKITQVVEKKPLFTIKLPFSNRKPLGYTAN